MTNAPDDKPSKTRRKRDMHALQTVGERLLEFSPERLSRMNLPEKLVEAVLAARRITKHEARRRQMQYIGRLMREIDPEPIREALAIADGQSAAQTAWHHELERLRARLLEDEAVLGEIAQRLPAADLGHLRTLRRNALREQATGKSPRAFRELFRVLRDTLEPTRPAASNGAGEPAS